MWAALLGAFIGRFFALASGLAIEIRRDCRRRIAAARSVVAEFSRAETEIHAAALVEHARVGKLDWNEKVPDEAQGFFPGPHPKITGDSWLAHAAEFVGVLNKEEFDDVERSWITINTASVWGFEIEDAGARAREHIARGRRLLTPFTRPSWFDRHVWRL